MLSLCVALQLAPPPALPPPGSPPVWAPPPGWTPPPATPPPPAEAPPPPREEVTWFWRLELGLGSPGFSRNAALLGDMGYPKVKMWATTDVAWMFHRHVGAGIFMAVSRRSGSLPRTSEGALDDVGWFLGAELPILLWGTRDYAFHFMPRGGWSAGQVEIDNAVDAELQHMGFVGGALSFQTFTYHVGSSIGFLHSVPEPELGELGGGHDFGGIYVTLGGSIDG
jgi:hypothetical protein